MTGRANATHGPAPYRLVHTAPPPVAPPSLDDAQRRVVEHLGGPLLVLAGPGTGKTTTLVEAVAARVARGAAPERILVLTFSRKAAHELRDRISRRLARTTATAPAATFHSFCHSLVAARRPAEDRGAPLRLLSGAEQDVAVRELLRGAAADAAVSGSRWPRAIAACLSTRGLAEEVRDVLARACERDVDLRSLAAAVAAGGSPGAAETADAWRALAGFAEEYVDVLDARGVLDHAELVRRAVALAESAPVRAELRARYDAVFVDEYQDSDPAQVRLLSAIAGDGRDLAVFGDPDQSIYAFRGADVRGILDFPDRFRTAAGDPAPTLVLGTSRRSTPQLLAAARVLAGRLPLSGLDAAAARAHRGLTAAVPAAAGAAPEVVTFPSAGAELEHVADTLRRAHLEDGLAWSDMAVLVRSGVRAIPAVRRALGSAGVPMAVAGDEIPLRAEPAVAVLLGALRAAADPAALTIEAARELLGSPLAGVDPAEARRLGRALRADARGAGVAAGDLAPSGEMIRDALADPRRLLGLPQTVQAASPARRLAELLAVAGDVIAGGGSAEDALWRLWSGTRWPARLAAAAAGAGAAARRADRDLDAVCALFDLAAGAEEKAGHRGVRNFLAEIEAQEIPGGPPRSGDAEADAVRVLTAHRSKGLEWPLVAVVGVQEGLWPDLRRRGTLLNADRIAPGGPVPPPSTAAMLAEERRLFYVAVTRAKRRLLVTAVAAADEDGERPSRFLRELGVEPAAARQRPARPLSIAGLVADLRSVLVDEASPEPLRAAAATRLAALAAARDDAGRALVPAAAPERWWGTAEATAGEAPVRDPARPVDLSGSAVAGLTGCPLQWFLRREVRAEGAATVALGFGNVIHALAEEVAAGGPTDLDALLGRLDTVWPELSFDAAWQSESQRDAAREALARFLAWHVGRPDRTLLGAEVPFEVEIEVPGSAAEGEGEGAPDTVRLRGQLDRVELDAAGRVRVADLKTSKTTPSGAALAAHPQLGVYQVAVAAGALDDVPGAGREPGGAELVMVRQEHRRSGLPKVCAQPPPAETRDPEWALRLLGEAARRVRAEAFGPLPSEDCDRCEFRRCCSGRAEGTQVIT